VLAFDKWTCNADGRQAALHRGRQQRGYTATFIDFGYAFNAGEWTFPDAPLRGTYAMNDVYKCARSLQDFAPWLQRIARVSARGLEQIAAEVPPEWYGEAGDMERLLEELFRRREMVPNSSKTSALPAAVHFPSGTLSGDQCKGRQRRRHPQRAITAGISQSIPATANALSSLSDSPRERLLQSRKFTEDEAWN
jgi:hypothetical protein